MDTLGKRIRHLRGAESQEDFARRIGVSKGSIGGYERDENSPSADAIIKICSLAKISSNWLLFGTGPIEADEATTGPVPSGEKDQELKKRIAELEWEKERLERHAKALAEENKLVWEMRLSREKDVECYREDIAHYKRVIDGLMQQLQQLVSKGEPITGAPVSATNAPSTSLTSDE